MLAKIEQKSPPIPMQPKVSVGMQHADRAPLNRAIESGAHSHRALRPSFHLFARCSCHVSLCSIYIVLLTPIVSTIHTQVYMSLYAVRVQVSKTMIINYTAKNWCLDHLWAYFWGGEHDDDEDRPENTLPSALSLLNAFSTSSFSSQKRILFTFCSSAVPLWR